MNKGVTTYTSGERDLRVLHSDVGERSQKRRRTHTRTHRGIGEHAHSDGGQVRIWHSHDPLRRFTLREAIVSGSVMRSPHDDHGAVARIPPEATVGWPVLEKQFEL